MRKSYLISTLLACNQIVEVEAVNMKLVGGMSTSLDENGRTRESDRGALGEARPDLGILAEIDEGIDHEGEEEERTDDSVDCTAGLQRLLVGESNSMATYAAS